MLFPRQIPERLVIAKTWQPRHAAHIVSVDGVPLSVLIKYSDSDIPAEEAMAAKDFARATNLYEQYLKADPGNYSVLLNYALALYYSNRLPESINVVQQAIKIDAGDEHAWSLLAELYTAANNNAAAQDAKNRALSIQAEQAESEE